MAVNFTKNQDEITKAWRKVVDEKDSQNWALFGYEANTNIINLMSTGSNGLEGLVRELNCSLVQYAFCRVLNKDINLNKLILINWQGDSAPLSRKGLCASHVGDVVDYFKGCTQTITIRNDDEATQEYLMEQILKSSHSRYNLMGGIRTNSVASSTRESSNRNDEPTKVSSAYEKIDIGLDIASDRKSFWQRQEEEEKERLLEEKKKAAEKQAQFEKARKLREESEAQKLAETIKERDRLIEATRKAEKKGNSPGNSQPSSILSSNANADDDDRVGRRSELIRLERNQETQSLISKGLIKNKRAIFEQAASQQQQQQPPQPSTLIRRTSGAMITQRMNSLKSLDSAASSTASSSTTPSSNNSSQTNVEKLTNGFVNQAKISEHSTTVKSDETKNPCVVKKEVVETVKVVDVESEKQDIRPPTLDLASEPKVAESKTAGDRPATPNKQTEAIKLQTENGASNNNDSLNKSGLSNNGTEQENGQEQQDEEMITGVDLKRSGVKAKTLYDYQAGDNTEISFDPDDIIGYIEKVDPGWWHGTVITGKFKGQAGLFPSNYVEEL